MPKKLFKGLGRESELRESDLRSVLQKKALNGPLDILSILKKEISRVEINLQKIDQYYKMNLRFPDRVSDRIAEIGGSWTFILSFFIFLVIWMVINSIILVNRPFDPYPFILLNLILSTLAAVQAPIILMSQNRAAKRDQARMEIDLEKDLRDLHVDQSSHEILLGLRKDMDLVKKKLGLK